MINIRIDGPESEVRQIVDRWIMMGIPTDDICKTFEIVSVNGFHPEENEIVNQFGDGGPPRKGYGHINLKFE